MTGCFALGSASMHLPLRIILDQRSNIYQEIFSSVSDFLATVCTSYSVLLGRSADPVGPLDMRDSFGRDVFRGRINTNIIFFLTLKTSSVKEKDQEVPCRSAVGLSRSFKVSTRYKSSIILFKTSEFRITNLSP